MDDPILSIQEREAINAGRWFCALSASLRHDILRSAHIRRYRPGNLIASRGEFPQEWYGCARGSVRVSSISVSGKQVTYGYIEPGAWFGDASLIDGDARMRDAHAHGDTTLLCVSRTDFSKILAQHAELSEALLRLQASRIQRLFAQVEDLNTLPLRARLAKQLMHLLHSYGVPHPVDTHEMRLGLHLAQEEIAQLLGASRQRVNQELKAMEREGVIRIESGGLVVRDAQRLQRIVDMAPDGAEPRQPAEMAQGPASEPAGAPVGAQASVQAALAA